MRKFKNKHTGDIVKTYSEHYYISTETACIPKRFIELSNDWEEVIEKDYEVIIARTVPYTILSIRRLSDGEVFTVGDLITGHSYTDARVIEKIEIRHDESIRLEQKYGSTELAYATKLKQPLFLTHDGKDIFEGDTVWWVRKESLHYSCFEAHSEISFCSDINVYFLTKAAAENYLVQKSHSLSIEDFWEFDSWGGSPIAKSKRLKRLVKERLNLE
jgi:hypothetical protein